jgi:hypothetical protein
VIPSSRFGPHVAQNALYKTLASPRQAPQPEAPGADPSLKTPSELVASIRLRFGPAPGVLAGDTRSSQFYQADSARGAGFLAADLVARHSALADTRRYSLVAQIETDLPWTWSHGRFPDRPCAFIPEHTQPFEATRIVGQFGQLLASFRSARIRRDRQGGYITVIAAAASVKAA